MKLQIDNTRREFLRKLIAGTCAMGMAPLLGSLQSCTTTGSDAGAVLKIPQRPFGATGESVGIYSLGAQATVEQVGMKEQAIAIVNKCIDMGINYIDTKLKSILDQNESIKQAQIDVL